MTPAEIVTTQFYEWEQRGRGWLTSADPICLEPPFFPFFFHTVLQASEIDDGRHSTLFSSIADLFKGRSQVPISPSLNYPEPEPIAPFLFECSEPLKTFSVFLPKGHAVGIHETEQLLLMLTTCRYPVSFEVVGRYNRISIQMACRVSDASYVKSQIKAFFPASFIKDNPDLIEESLTSFGFIFEFGLKDEFMRPIAMADGFKLDPFIGLFGTLEQIEPDERVVIQTLFEGAVNPWAESIMRAVTDNEGKPFFADAPDMVPLAKEKIAYPLFAATLRVLASGDTPEQAAALAQRVGRSLLKVGASKANGLISVTSNSYGFDTLLDGILNRQSNRLGMLLNSRELATFVHFPSESVTTSTLERNISKTKAAPTLAEGHAFILGINENQGKEREVSVSAPQRLKHTHIIGATGTGKSTLLLKLISQDIQQGKGVAVLDPHGDLIDSILTRIPENRFKDVILIDPSDADFPVGFNILSAHSEIEKNILSSDLVSAFKRLSASWGDQMNSVLANAILAFLESNKGGTLVDLRRFLIEKEFRNDFLKTVTDSNIVYYWQKEFPLLKSNSIASILTRLDTFLRPKLIRNMVAQKKGLDFEHILDSGKILLVKLSQGLIGEENSYLLGTFIVSKIHQAAMARQGKQQAERNDFFLYIDEFQNFITPSMSGILSGARKYHLGLILAHQDLQQLSKEDSELASSVISNAGTRICFRLGDIDAKKLENGFSFFEAQDLQNLRTGEAIARIERPEFDFNMTTIPLSEIEEATAQEVTASVIAESRRRYGTPRQEVESQFDILQKTETQKEATKKEELVIVPPFKKEEEKIKEPSKGIKEADIADTTQKLVEKKEVSQHRYLQTLIKRMAESRGYKATLETPTPDGAGRVDVLLERENETMACEVSVTTPEAWEIHNIQKCLKAGYTFVVTCVPDSKTVEGIKEKILETLDITSQKKVAVFEPESFFKFLDERLVAKSSTQTHIKGYRVSVEYDSVPKQEMDKKRESVAKLVLGSLRKIKNK